MKRIINGLTYNTDTSTRLAKSEWLGGEAYDANVVGILYVTRGGAYFVHEEETARVYNARSLNYDTKVTDSFTPLSREAAEKWMIEGDVQVFNNPFGDPEEASAELEPSESILIRMPATLKRQIEAAASKESLSCNMWAQRCLERSL